MSQLQPLSQIFNKKLFRIPDYQRGYAWREHQLQDFWEDIINLRKEKYHYTGLLSLQPLINSPEQESYCSDHGYQVCHVVDGQQRLTTFVIFLNELLNFIIKLPENQNLSPKEIFLDNRSVQDIRRQYLYFDEVSSIKNTIFIFGYEENAENMECLKYQIFELPYSGAPRKTYYTQNLQQAKDFFAKKIADRYQKYGKDDIVELYRKLTTKIMFNVNEIGNDYDIFVAFETMNNRGKPLTNLELLKNRLIFLTTLYDDLKSSSEKALRDEINDAWREIYQQLGRNDKRLLSDDEFLKAHWLTYFSYSRKTGNDYIDFLLNKFSYKAILGEDSQKMSEDQEDDPSNELLDDDYDDDTEDEQVEAKKYLAPIEIQEYVKSLKELAQYWYYTYFPEDCPLINEQEKVWIDRLNRLLPSHYFRPLVAVSMLPRLEISSAERIQFLQAAERFIFMHFGMAPNAYRSNYQNSTFYGKTKEVYQGRISLSDVTEELDDLTNTNQNEILAKFAELTDDWFKKRDGFYSWGSLKYVLFEYEKHLEEIYHRQGLNKILWSDFTKHGKDRITIEHILPQTPTEYYWRNTYRQFNAEEIRTLTGALGNLLPLSQAINSSLQNDSFDEKKHPTGKRSNGHQRIGYDHGSLSENDICDNVDWSAIEIHRRTYQLFDFMQKRWSFCFKDEDQKERISHISFVGDERRIPAPLPKNAVISDFTVTDGDYVDRYGYISALIREWVIKKSATGEIIALNNNKRKRYIRFSTPMLRAKFPDTPTPSSGWGTTYHCAFEINHKTNGDIRIGLVFNTIGTPEWQKEKYAQACRAVGIKLRDGWQWHTAKSTRSQKIDNSTNDSEIIQILDNELADILQKTDALLEAVS